MANYKTYLIGRSGDADIQLADESVSRSHAELVCAGGEETFLTDRCSSGGTFVHRDGAWQELRQSWIGREERLRFGNLEIAATNLIAKIPDQGSVPAEVGVEDERPRGRVARNPVTGEIESTE